MNKIVQCSCQQTNNQNMIEDVFLKSLLSFMNESDQSDDSGYASEIFSVDNVVTSGNFCSFSAKTHADLIYRRCNFSNRLYSSWTNQSAGLVPSVRESKSTNSTKWKPSCLTTKADLHQSVPLDTVEDKSQFFKKYLRNSLLPPLENHPVRLRMLGEDLGSVDSQARSITKRAPPGIKQNLSLKLEKGAYSSQTYKICRFCLKNGEPEVFYTGHLLKAHDGTTACPILRRYVCDLCGATGPNSHTRKYCPRYEEVLAQSKYRTLTNGMMTINLNHK